MKNYHEEQKTDVNHFSRIRGWKNWNENEEFFLY